MKKILALLLALVMALSLFGCAGMPEELGGLIETLPLLTEPADTEPEETEPNPEVIIEQLKQNPVTIPLPPVEEVPEEGTVRYFSFEKPEKIYYQPRHLPPSLLELEENPGWEIHALIAIGVAMVVVAVFPTKKLRRKLYRRGRFMVK